MRELKQTESELLNFSYRVLTTNQNSFMTLHSDWRTDVATLEISEVPLSAEKRKLLSKIKLV